MSLYLIGEQMYKSATVECLGYKIYAEKLDLICRGKGPVLINTINQYSYCIAEKNHLFKRALLNSDVLLPDGVGITAAVKLLTGNRIKKIAGADLHQHLLERLNKVGGRCFYLGSSAGTLKMIVHRLKTDYPNVCVGTFSPPYKSAFDEVDNQTMLKAVNEFEPEVLFVGMTAPKQEQWAYMHREQLGAEFICSIGAVFDFYAGTIARPKDVWIKLKLEWFIRLLREPKRMGRRYLYYGPIYIGLLVKQKIKLALYPS